jgi:hypothetical protein
MIRNIAQNRGRLGLLAAVVLATLFTGLTPKGYNFHNNVKWALDGNGIEFGIYGTASTDPFLSSELAEQFTREGFTLELALNGLEKRQEAFAFIVQFYADDEQTQLVLGQWSDYLIVMNGNDYRHRLRTPRITFKLPQPSAGDHFLTVTSGPGGTRFYFDGQLVSDEQDLDLQIPGATEKGRLVLGNSAFGINPWQGIIGGLAHRGRVLDGGNVLERYEQWKNTASFPIAEIEEAIVLYDFTGKTGRVAHDHSIHHYDLHFRESDVIAKKQFLEIPFQQVEFNRSFVSDVVVNLFGFIPFGLALSFLLHGFGIGGVRNVVVVTVTAAALSFGIEFVQAWMPSRSSSAFDLWLNIVGGFLGAFFLGWLVVDRSVKRSRC